MKFQHAGCSFSHICEDNWNTALVRRHLGAPTVRGSGSVWTCLQAGHMQQVCGAMRKHCIFKAGCCFQNVRWNCIFATFIAAKQAAKVSFFFNFVINVYKKVSFKWPQHNCTTFHQNERGVFWIPPDLIRLSEKQTTN